MKVVVAILLGVLLTLGFVWIMPNTKARAEVRDTGDKISEEVSDAGRKVKDAFKDIDTEKGGQGVEERGQQCGGTHEGICF